MDVEQSAFAPAALVSGIEFSNDKILQGRAFAYGDTQRYRIGVNYLELPTNRPRTPVHNTMQDGAMQTRFWEGIANYYPNTLGMGLPVPAPKTGKPEQEFVAGIIERKKIEADDYGQARYRYRTMSALEKEHLISNLLEALSQVYEPIQRRTLAHFMQVDGELGTKVAQGLNLSL